MNTDNLTGLDAIRRIALAYDDASDELSSIPEELIFKIRKLIADQFAWIVWEWGFYIDFTDKDPYEYKLIEELLPDFCKKIIKVNTSGNESKFWGPFYNLSFRAVHDWIHTLRELNFDYEDEIKAFKAQIEFYPYNHSYLTTTEEMDIYYRVLRSEIIYQASFKTYFGISHVPIQKIILSDL